MMPRRQKLYAFRRESSKARAFAGVDLGAERYTRGSCGSGIGSIPSTTYQGNDVPSGEGEDVGARHLVRARRHGVDGRLGLDDRVEAVAGEGEVVGVVLLRRAVPRRHQDHGRVASLGGIAVTVTGHMASN